MNGGKRTARVIRAMVWAILGWVLFSVTAGICAGFIVYYAGLPFEVQKYLVAPFAVWGIVWGARKGYRGGRAESSRARPAAVPDRSESPSHRQRTAIDATTHAARMAELWRDHKEGRLTDREYQARYQHAVARYMGPRDAGHERSEATPISAADGGQLTGPNGDLEADDLARRLDALNDLHDSGHISEEEHRAMRNRLLDRFGTDREGR